MNKTVKCIALGLLGGVVNGLFGAGGGSIIVPALEKFLGFEAKRAHATAIGIILIMSAVSSVLYIKEGYFNAGIWVYVTLGGLAGGFAGAKALKKIPLKWLKIIFGAVIIITAIKMVI